MPTEPMTMMDHLCGPLWWASRKRFVKPGLWWCNAKGNRRIVALPRPAQPPRLVEFPEQTTVIAKDQPEYNPLPAHRFKDDTHGRIACCWQLSWRDRLKVLRTGKVWHQILTFNQPLQPQLLTVDKPEMKP